VARDVWRRQPRWPGGTPIGPGGRGPGGGRFRDGAPGSATGGWLGRLSQALGRGAGAPDPGLALSRADDYDARLHVWEAKATKYLREVENLRDDEIDRFWENVALNGGAGPDDHPDPEQWAANELMDFYEDDDEDGLLGDDGDATGDGDPGLALRRTDDDNPAGLPDETDTDAADKLETALENAPEGLTPSGAARAAGVDTTTARRVLEWMVANRFAHKDDRGAWTRYYAGRG